MTWPFARGQGFLVAVAVGAVACFGLGLFGRWTRGIGWGCACLAAEFAVRLQLDPAGVGPWTPLFGGGLLLTAELAFWSFEAGSGRQADVRRAARRAGLMLAIAAGAALAGQLAFLVPGLVPVGGPGLLVAGLAAALAVPAILVGLRRGAPARDLGGG